MSSCADILVAKHGFTTVYAQHYGVTDQAFIDQPINSSSLRWRYDHISKSYLLCLTMHSAIALTFALDRATKQREILGVGCEGANTNEVVDLC